MPQILIEAYQFNYMTVKNEVPRMIVDVLFFMDKEDFFNRRMNKAMTVVPEIAIPASGGEIFVPMPPKGRGFVFRGKLADGKEALATPSLYGNDGQKVTLYFDPVKKEKKVEEEVEGITAQ